MQFKNKVVVITGASSGIGRALAYEFASHGARIVMGARSEEKLQQIAADLKSRNTEVAYAPTDVTQEADCRRLIETAVTRFGGVDHIDLQCRYLDACPVRRGRPECGSDD